MIERELQTRTPPDGGGGRRARDALVRRLQRTLPRGAYRALAGGYRGARTLVGRTPGHGRALPDFVIIGAAKAGTTSLYGWLCEHPGVLPPRRRRSTTSTTATIAVRTGTARISRMSGRSLPARRAGAAIHDGRGKPSVPLTCVGAAAAGRSAAAGEAACHAPRSRRPRLLAVPDVAPRGRGALRVLLRRGRRRGGAARSRSGRAASPTRTTTAGRSAAGRI